MRNKYFFIKRNKAITEYVARFEGLKSKGGTTASLHDFAFGVCLSNKGIAKGFLSRLHSKHPDIVASVQRSLTARQSERLKSKSR